MHLRRLCVEPDAAAFNILIDQGDENSLPRQQSEAIAQKLIEYFLIGVSLPDKEFWVNLRPDGQSRMIAPDLERTDMGRILLEADLELKKDLARFTSPDTKEGKRYWDKLYQKAEGLFGQNDMEIPTMTRPWIVPGEIIVGESGNGAYIYKAMLEVRLEEDMKEQQDQRVRELNAYASALLKEKILSLLTREVNTSKKYAALRQVFYSLVLAQWFKQRYAAYNPRLTNRIDQRDLTGLVSGIAWSKSAIHEAYRRSFLHGEYAKEETVRTDSGMCLRQYVSGGMALDGGDIVVMPLAESILRAGSLHQKEMVVPFPASVFANAKDGGNKAELQIRSLAVYAGLDRLLDLSYGTRPSHAYQLLGKIAGSGNAEVISYAIRRLSDKIDPQDAYANQAMVFHALAEMFKVDPNLADPVAWAEFVQGLNSDSREIRVICCEGLLAVIRNDPGRLAQDQETSALLQNMAANDKEKIVRSAATAVLAAAKGSPKTVKAIPAAVDQSVQPGITAPVERSRLQAELKKLENKNDVDILKSTCQELASMVRNDPTVIDGSFINSIRTITGLYYPVGRIAGLGVVEEILKYDPSGEVFQILMQSLYDRDSSVRDKGMEIFVGMVIRQGLLKDGLSMFKKPMTDRERERISALVLDTLAARPQGLMRIFEAGYADAGKLQEALERLLMENLSAAINKPAATWLNMAEQLITYNEFASRVDRIIHAFVVKLLLIQQGVVKFHRMKLPEDQDWPDYYWYSLAHVLPKINSISLRRQFVKATGVTTEDSIGVLRKRAIEFSTAVYGHDSKKGIAGTIRYYIHQKPSPLDLQAARAYLEFVRDGDLSKLRSLNYPVEDPDVIPAERKNRVIAATTDLIAVLEGIYGENSEQALLEYYKHWQKAVKAGSAFKEDLEAILLNASKKDLDYLRSINRLRSRLTGPAVRPTNYDMMTTLGLDIRLENLYYSSFGIVEAGLDYSDEKMALTAVASLLEGVRLNGYCQEEISLIMPEIENILAQADLSGEDRLRIYSIYRRIERIIGRVSEETIVNYQDIAAEFGRASGKEDSIWVTDFSANMLRSDLIYLLASALEKARNSLMEKARISTWQVVQPGKVEGRIKIVKYYSDLQLLQGDEIVIIDSLPDDSRLLIKARGIITSSVECLLSHPAIRARQLGTVLVTSPDISKIKELAGAWVELDAHGESVDIKKIDAPAENALTGAKIKPRSSNDVKLIRPDLSWQKNIVLPDEYLPERVGNKAYKLNLIPQDILVGQKIGKHFSLSFAFLQKILDDPANAQIKTDLAQLREKLRDDPQGPQTAHTLYRLRSQIENLAIPQDSLTEIADTARRLFGPDALLFVRSSTNAEDLEGYPAAGLYDSFGAVEIAPAEIGKYVKKVLASVWNDRAFYDRQANSIAQDSVFPAVLIQEMIVPEYSFVIHTRAPGQDSAAGVMIEAVQGFGEALVSGSKEYAGMPYRFSLDRSTGRIKIVSFANKSRRIVLKDKRFDTVPTDYLDDWLVTARGRELLEQIGLAALKLEERFNSPQDIEGVIVLENGRRAAGFVQTRFQFATKQDGGAVGGIDLTNMRINSGFYAARSSQNLSGMTREYSPAESEALWQEISRSLAKHEQPYGLIKDYLSAAKVSAATKGRQQQICLWAIDILRQEEENALRSPRELKEILVLLS